LRYIVVQTAAFDGCRVKKQAEGFTTESEERRAKSEERRAKSEERRAKSTENAEKNNGERG
jgi:hypothetical protein